MEIVDGNKLQVFEKLQDKGFISLVNDIKETLRVNEESYPNGSEYGTDKGYGAKIFLIDSVKELIEIKSKFRLFGLCSEYDKAIIEMNGKVSHYILYLIGSDNGVVIYSIDK